MTETVNYGSPFVVQTPDAADIASVVLVRPGTPTHAFDMDQRLVGLSFTAGSGELSVTAPSNGNIAPPGYYMLFVLNSAGVPSVARFVRLVAAPPNQAPVATITTPASAVTVNPGQKACRSPEAERIRIRVAVSPPTAGRSPAAFRARAQSPHPAA